MPAPRPQPAPDPLLLPVKAVPGAKRDGVVGWLGDRLKVRVSAPPEGGRANGAICRLIAAELGVRPAAVTVVRGGSSPEKTLAIDGVTLERVIERWPRR